MPELIIAPTEPPSLRAIADAVSMLPEQYGCDVFFWAQKRKVGIQRKEIKDLIASVNDGRLVKEIGQMGSLEYKILIVEGEIGYTNDDILSSTSKFGKPWSRSQLNGLFWSIQDRGIWLVRTDDLSDTIRTVQMLVRWFSKAKHSSLSTRPGIGKGMWGTGPTHKEFATWFLQGIPGVGHDTAEKVFDAMGLPLVLVVDEKGLMEVEGIGKKKAESIVKLFTEEQGA